MTFLGIIIVIVGLVLLFGLTFYILPKKLIRFKFLSDVKEGDLAPDYSYYVAEKENKEVFDSYRIFVDKSSRKKVLKIDFREEIHRVEFYVIFFDFSGHPFGCKKYVVDDAQTQDEVVVPDGTRGAFVQTMSVEENVYHTMMPWVLTSQNLIVASIWYAVLATVCLFVSGWGMMFLTGAWFNAFVIMIMAILVMLAFGIGAYFLIRLTLKDRIFSKEVK